MDNKDIVKFCKDLGCCDACCLRYLGLRTPQSYENPKDTILKYQDEIVHMDTLPAKDIPLASNTNGTNLPCNTTDNYNYGMEDTGGVNDGSGHINSVPKDNNGDLQYTGVIETEDCEMPPAKRYKMNVCASCLGLLQENTWQDSIQMVKDVLEKKQYASETFACGLSSPIATNLREKAIILRLLNKFPNFKSDGVTTLKICWKWSFAAKLADYINMTLDSGSKSPLLITLNYDYPDDLQELEILKTTSPKLFQSRSQQRNRFSTEFTRRSVDQALEEVTYEGLMAAGGGLPLATANAKCVSVVCTHAPIYIAGRYLKLSRCLPQSPWVLEGRRVLPTSVQEIIFKPLANLYTLNDEEAEQRFKFVSAGREDVDVRCLGDGRPFAIEILDPRRQLTEEELAAACDEISRSGDVIVKSLVPIKKEDLIELKKGEETKSKIYEALCIKLSHSKYDHVPPDAPVTVTEGDIKRINEYRNTPVGDPFKIQVMQKTPIRVLHRRPLLTRTRGIINLTAYNVAEHPALLRVVAQTTAGTYVKEWVSGELGRSRPSLGEALGARAALAALDVIGVNLRWPPPAAGRTGDDAIEPE